MAAKKEGGTTINVKGNITAGRDVIQGDQHNYGTRDERVVQISNAEEFRQALADLQTKIAVLKQGELTTVQTVLVESAEKKVAEAREETKKEKPDGSKITKTLNDAKEAFDALKGGLTSAVGLGATLASIIGMAIKLFGG